MKTSLKIEEIAMLGLSIYLFSFLDFAWWWYIALFFLPDISFLAYTINSKVGAYAYNFLHHKGIMIFLFVLGFYVQNEILQLIGIVFFGHSSFDRFLGYGLKYTDSFNNTHLGKIGKN